jgi:hypothetical protein
MPEVIIIKDILQRLVRSAYPIASWKQCIKRDAVG